MANNKNVILITEIAVVTALALAFDAVAQFYSFRLFPNGGSISFAMLPVMVIAFRRGVLPGIISGVLLGALQTIWFPPYIGPVNPVVGYFLDYPVGYGLVGLAGLTRKWVYSDRKEIAIAAVVAGVLIGGIARTISVVVSGVYAWLSNWWASIAYNFPYMIPSIIICAVVAVVIYTTAKNIFVLPENDGEVLIIE